MCRPSSGAGGPATSVLPESRGERRGTLPRTCHEDHHHRRQRPHRRRSSSACAPAATTSPCSRATRSRAPATSPGSPSRSPPPPRRSPAATPSSTSRARTSPSAGPTTPSAASATRASSAPATSSPASRPPTRARACSSRASAVGYYGPHGDERARRGRRRAGDDFLAEVCVVWEREAQRAAEELGLRVVHVRTGVVLDADGGALAKMLPPFKLGVGGPVAGGAPVPAVDPRRRRRRHLPRRARRRRAGRARSTPRAPEPVTNKAFSKALGRALHRPAFAPVPGLRHARCSTARWPRSSPRASAPSRSARSELGYALRAPGPRRGPALRALQTHKSAHTAIILAEPPHLTRHAAASAQSLRALGDDLAGRRGARPRSSQGTTRQPSGARIIVSARRRSPPRCS